MSWLSRLVSVIRSDRLNRDLDDEIRFHLDARIEEDTQAGPVHRGGQRTGAPAVRQPGAGA